MRSSLLLLTAALGTAALMASASPAFGQIERDFIPVWRPDGPVSPSIPAPPPQSVLRVAVAQQPRPTVGPPVGSSPSQTPLPPPPSEGPSLTAGPPIFHPWWQSSLLTPLRRDGRSVRITLDNAVLGTLEHSPQVRVLAINPQIRDTAIVDQESHFDTQGFAESRFTNTSDPVGSTLTTGGPDRFMDQNWYYSSGVKRTTETGASVSLSQKIGYENSNSIYFVPPNQGTSRIEAALTQPLLNGAGRCYNDHGIMLAQIDSNIARDQFSKDLQAMLVEIHRDYWDLYFARATLLQRRKLYQSALDIHRELNARREVDVLGNQIIRAKAAVAARESDVIRAEANVRNAEARVRGRINDPVLLGPSSPELIPKQVPNADAERVDLRESLMAALARRPEINQATKELRAAGVRAEVSANEMLPVLNMVLGGYVSGLEGNVDIGKAFADQFSEGRPTYFGGLQFQMPLDHRGPCARNRQRQLEVQQLSSNLEAVTQTVRTEVEIAVREVDATYREMMSRREAMLSEDSEIRYLVDRWRLLPGDQQGAGSMLDDLLTAQERLAKAEADYAASEVSFNLAKTDLHRADGTLLDRENVRQIDIIGANLPMEVVGHEAASSR
jgi:outer membrane protein TolC